MEVVKKKKEEIRFGDIGEGVVFKVRNQSSETYMKMSPTHWGGINSVELGSGLTYHFKDNDIVFLVRSQLIIDEG